jgi:hypothetical protein
MRHEELKKKLTPNSLRDFNERHFVRNTIYQLEPERNVMKNI